MERNSARELTSDEHVEIVKRVADALSSKKFDAVLATDGGNVTYLLGGRTLPYVDQRQFYPVAVLRCQDSGLDTLVCPIDQEALARRIGWAGRIIAFGTSETSVRPAFVAAISDALQAAGGVTRVGYDAEAISHGLVQDLTAAAKGVSFESDDGLLQDLRAVKTAGELRMLAFAARLADRAVVSAFNHSEGSARDILSYSLWEFMERIRVHVGEFGGSGTGHVSAMQGKRAGVLYEQPERHEALRPGEMLRAEWTNHHRGYWTSAARTISVGALPEALAVDYAKNQQIKKAVADAIKPGVTGADLCAVAAKEAGRIGAVLWTEPGIGHGVGTSEREAPFLVPDSDTPLQANMVISLAIYTRGADDGLIVDKDIHRVTDSGHERLSWYKDYRNIYELVGTTARHG